MTTISEMYVLGCILGLVTIPACFADYIYFASPGGSGDERPGMYGGPIRNEDNGDCTKLYSSGYHCAILQEPDAFNDMQFKSISYDPVSKNVLMHVDHQLTLLKSPVCRAQPPNCEDRSNYVEPIFIKRQVSSEVKPVAMYDSTVYFLHFGSETVDTNDKDATLELRKFRGCESEYPVTGHKAFDLDVCSERIATIQEERYKRAPTFKAADHLLVIRDGHSLRFFTIIKKFEFEGRRIQSYKFQLVTIYGSKVEVIDEQEVDRVFNMFSLGQLGGISYLDRTLCWSAVSRVICADWRGTDLVNRRVIIDDVAATKVCKGSSEKLTSNVTTGVAIASTSPDLVIYFGCLTDASGKGGMGMIRVKRDGTKELKNVTNDGEKVLAGSMFITKECKMDEPKPSNGNHPTISGGTNPSKESQATKGTKETQGTPGSQGYNNIKPEPAGSSYGGSSSTPIPGFLSYASVLTAAILVAVKFL